MRNNTNSAAIKNYSYTYIKEIFSVEDKDLVHLLVQLAANADPNYDNKADLRSLQTWVAANRIFRSIKRGEFVPTKLMKDVQRIQQRRNNND